MKRGIARRWRKHRFPFVAFVVAMLVLPLVVPTPRTTEPAGAALPTTTRPPTTTTTSTTTTTTTSTTIVAPDVTVPPVEDGLAPVVSRIKTVEPVVFLTIDDGAHKEVFELELMQANGLRASLFLANSFIRSNPSFFIPFVTAGNVIENHSLTHRNLTHLSYEEQRQEICGEADMQEQQFGKRPTLFRPPGGAFNTNTRRAAAACGMRAVVNWIAKADSGSMQYQLASHLRPGDIVLMHFRPEFAADMAAFLEAMNAAGLHTELLEDWL